jgi:hypothetical protein
MPNKHPRMKLSPEEERFLRHWIYDEVHYQTGSGPAKELQLLHRATPADLAMLIAAGLPDPNEQEAAGKGLPPREPPVWPWDDKTFHDRLLEARTVLMDRLRAARAG